jgi:hypothetical protein
MRSSRADERLIAALADRDLAVSARQLERWRQYGLLVTERRSLGRGLGSTSEYAPGSAALVENLLQKLAAQRQLDLAVLGLFDEGIALPEAVVKRAYANLFARLTTTTRRSSETTAQAAARLERGFLRQIQGRAWRRQLVRAGFGVDAFQSLIAAVIALAFDSRPPTDDELALMLEASGLAPVGRRLAEQYPGADWGEARHLLELFSVTRLAAATAGADLDQLRAAAAQATQLFALVVPAATVFSGVLGFADGRRVFGVDLVTARAAAAPTLLVLAELEDVDAAHTQAGEWQPQFDSLAAVLNTLPFWYGQLFTDGGPERIARLKPGRREHVRARIRAAVDGVPDARELLTVNANTSKS